MNYKTVASALLSRIQRSSTPLVLVGEMQNELGSDGFSEALRLRWLSCDNEGGGLMIATSGPMLEQLKAVCNGDYSSLEGVVHEDNSGGYQVGDEVIVTVSGQPVTARVKRVLPDGSIDLDDESGKIRAPVKRDSVRPVSRPSPEAPGKPKTQSPLAQDPVTHQVRPDSRKSASTGRDDSTLNPAVR